MLDRLFEYGSEKGGMVHMLCSDDVASSIGSFIEEYGINKIVLGEPPAKMSKGESEFDKIEKILKKCGTEIIIVKRQKEKESVEA